MQPLLEAKQQIVAQLKKAIGKGFIVVVDDLEMPPHANMGDLAFPCFRLAKEKKRNPQELAVEISAKIGPKDFIESAHAVGPYVNIRLNASALGNAMFKAIEDKKVMYGITQTGHGKKILVEYAQPNTHKEFHVGHVRNGLLGQAMINILRANGYEVIGASYMGDIGAHVAKVLWGLRQFHAGEVFTPEERAKKLGEIYTETTAYLEEHPDIKKEIDTLQCALEEGDKGLRSLWEETREWSLEEFRSIFKELNIKPDVWYFESEVEKEGKDIVNTLLTQGIARKSEGATIVDLEEEKLGVFLVLKSDGSSLYATKDLALALKKDETYHADRQIFIVDTRQSLYFKQLFAVLKRMGFGATLQHIAYDMVTLPSGAMSSRKGNVVTYKTLRDDAVQVFYDETKKRHEDWDEKKLQEISHSLAHSAMAFFMLRQNAESVITFDQEEALSFDGFTGPYIIYTNARLHRLLEKAKEKPVYDAMLLTHAHEKALIKKLAQYPEIILLAGSDFDPSHIAHWLFDVARLFSEYYHEVRIVDADSKDMIRARLGLVSALIKTIEHAMTLLGMRPIDEM